jgi:ubiquitin C-terminal hydrolase
VYINLGENQYRVPKGIEGLEGGLQDAEKRLSLIDLPDVLCLTLKRFTFDISTSSMKKVSKVYLFFSTIRLRAHMLHSTLNTTIIRLRSF